MPGLASASTPNAAAGGSGAHPIMDAGYTNFAAQPFIHALGSLIFQVTINMSPLAVVHLLIPFQNVADTACWSG